MTELAEQRNRRAGLSLQLREVLHRRFDVFQRRGHLRKAALDPQVILAGSSRRPNFFTRLGIDAAQSQQLPARREQAKPADHGAAPKQRAAALPNSKVVAQRLRRVLIRRRLLREQVQIQAFGAGALRKILQPQFVRDIENVANLIAKLQGVRCGRRDQLSAARWRDHQDVKRRPFTRNGAGRRQILVDPHGFTGERGGDSRGLFGFGGIERTETAEAHFAVLHQRLPQSRGLQRDHEARVFRTPESTRECCSQQRHRVHADNRQLAVAQDVEPRLKKLRVRERRQQHALLDTLAALFAEREREREARVAIPLRQPTRDERFAIAELDVRDHLEVEVFLHDVCQHVDQAVLEALEIVGERLVALFVVRERRAHFQGSAAHHIDRCAPGSEVDEPLVRHARVARARTSAWR